MKTARSGTFINKSRGMWLAWLLATIGWVALAIAEQEHQVRNWADYHFDFETTAANYRAQQEQALSYREQLLAQIASAASAAEAEVRRQPGSLAKVSPQFLEYEATKAAAKATASKKYELTHSTGNIFLDLQNEDALASEVHVGAPLPRPSSSWLFALLAPPLVLALIVALAPRIFSAALKTNRGRVLIAATILWPLTGLAWGFIFEWENHFQLEQYLGLLLLPPLLAAVGVSLWHWARRPEA